MTKAVFGFAALVAAAGVAQGGIVISEYMYDGADGEFVELFNSGTTAVDFTGWSYDDNSRTPGSESLSAFGIVQPGDVLIITEAAEADFRAAWNLPASVKIVGGITNNIGRSDELNIYDAANNLVDRLTYGDQVFPGTFRTQRISATTTPGNWGANNIVGWFGSASGDALGSYQSANLDLGNPGIVPAPGAVALLGLGALMAGWRKR